MPHITFSSASLPDNLDERQRFKLWRDIYRSQVGQFDFAISEKLPFEATIEMSMVGSIVIGKLSGTLERVTRTASNIANDCADLYCLMVNKGAAMTGAMRNRTFELPGGAAALLSISEPGSLMRPSLGAGDDWLNILVPGPVLRAAIKNPDDFTAHAITAASPALSLLVNYAMMLESGDLRSSPNLAQLATTHLLDLMTLALGVKGETAEIAKARGVRAVRLQAVLGQIAQRFSNVAFSTRDIAAALNISVRYVNDLLQESGIGFTERILELRLQRARAILSDRLSDGMRIGDIAYASGFADISHFNRSFRRRFGTTPTGAR